MENEHFFFERFCVFRTYVECEVLYDVEKVESSRIEYVSLVTIGMIELRMPLPFRATHLRHLGHVRFIVALFVSVCSVYLS